MFQKFRKIFQKLEKNCENSDFSPSRKTRSTCHVTNLLCGKLFLCHMTWCHMCMSHDCNMNVSNIFHLNTQII